VQAVLDEYWPGTCDLSAMRRREDHTVYSAYFGDEKVVVKSSGYRPFTEKTEKNHATFVNFLSEELTLAYYIEPNVVHSDDETMQVTMSKFLSGGENPTELQPDAPYTWVFEEDVAKSLGKFWSDFRT